MAASCIHKSVLINIKACNTNDVAYVGEKNKNNSNYTQVLTDYTITINTK